MSENGMDRVRTHARTHARNVMSSIPLHISQTLIDLRARRDYIDQAIHVLSSIWESENGTALAAAGNGAPVESGMPASPAKPIVQERRATPRKRADHELTADAELVLKTLRGRAPMKPSDVMSAAKLPKIRAARAKGLLQRRGLLTVEGTARASRWSLPAAGVPAKEGL